MTFRTIHDKSLTLDELKGLKADREEKLKTVTNRKYPDIGHILLLQEAIRDLSEYIIRKSR